MKFTKTLVLASESGGSDEDVGKVVDGPDGGVGEAIDDTTGGEGVSVDGSGAGIGEGVGWEEVRCLNNLGHLSRMDFIDLLKMPFYKAVCIDADRCDN